MYHIYKTDIFAKKFKKLDHSIQLRFLKYESKLSSDPYAVGKPIYYRLPLRELKINKFRFYYFINNLHVIIVFVDISEKKNQQEVINELELIIKNINFNTLKDNYGRI